MGEYGGRLSEGEGSMAEQVYTSRVRIERVRGPIRHAYIAPFEPPVRFVVHNGVEPDEEVPATLDYMIAAVGG